VNIADQGSALPLTTLKVLDLTDGKGEMAARFLADLGADVVRVEPQDGAPSRQQQPVVDGISLHYLTHNANKRAVTLDPTSDTGRGTFLDLVAWADILIDSATTDEREKLGLEPSALRAHNPALVVVSVTDFGRTGPYRDWVATEWTHLALGGVLSRSGHPDDAPLMPPGSLAYESAAISAAWVALLAYYSRLETGIGDEIDVSVFETTTQIVDPGYGMAGSATGGVPIADGPRGRPHAGHQYPIFACTDGAVRLCILSPRQWQGMFSWMGSPEEFADPELAVIGKRFAQAHRIYPAIGRFLADMSASDIVAQAETFGVPAASVRTPQEVLTSEQYAARGAFVRHPTGSGKEICLPNGFVEIDEQRAGIRHPAPSHGEHTDEVLAELAAHAAAPAVSAAQVPSRSKRRPLEGLRVLDLGVIVAGGEAGRLFADMGADVIKVENRAFPDGSRQSMTGDLLSPVFAWGHRNKTSLGLNLRDPEGVVFFKRLVLQSDIVLSNFKPGTLDKLGLGYQQLAEVNPGIVVVDSSAFGPSGPWSSRLGYGPLVRAETGLTGLWRNPSDDAAFGDASTIYPDHVAARIAAIGALALIVRRQRTGRGGKVSVAQAEVIIGQHAHLFALESLVPGAVTQVGNSRPGDAPRGVYPAAGDDEWVVVDIRGDEDFARLSAVMERTDLASDPRYSSPLERAANREQLDDAVAAWLSVRDPRTAMDILQEAGIPAAMMYRVTDFLDDPHLLERKHFRTMVHPHVNRALPTENTPARFLNVPDVELAPAPLRGQQTKEIARRLLGLDELAIDDLLARGVLEEG